ncbi:hypothetical protein I79_015449 [Cricetulus griseus]|uniref:Uncharacterized protein n=1 Tax=Cricetulus griseus TaxID=10029 RepID=G3HWT6_CRIGR|nr:hypothetical protein I79_015449 [Cricetulus griseus]
MHTCVYTCVRACACVYLELLSGQDEQRPSRDKGSEGQHSSGLPKIAEWKKQPLLMDKLRDRGISLMMPYGLLLLELPKE